LVWGWAWKKKRNECIGKRDKEMVCKIGKKRGERKGLCQGLRLAELAKKKGTRVKKQRGPGREIWEGSRSADGEADTKGTPGNPQKRKKTTTTAFTGQKTQRRWDRTKKAQGLLLQVFATSQARGWGRAGPFFGSKAIKAQGAWVQAGWWECKHSYIGGGRGPADRERAEYGGGQIK